MKASKFKVKGLDNSSMPDIKHSMKNHEGINQVRVDIQANTVTIDYDEHKYSQQDIENFINLSGLTVMGLQEQFDKGAWQ